MRKSSLVIVCVVLVALVFSMEYGCAFFGHGGASTPAAQKGAATKQSIVDKTKSLKSIATELIAEAKTLLTTGTALAKTSPQDSGTVTEAAKNVEQNAGQLDVLSDGFVQDADGIDALVSENAHLTAELAKAKNGGTSVWLYVIMGAFVLLGIGCAYVRFAFAIPYTGILAGLFGAAAACMLVIIVYGHLIATILLIVVLAALAGGLSYLVYLIVKSLHASVTDATPSASVNAFLAKIEAAIKPAVAAVEGDPAAAAAPGNAPVK